MCIIKDCDLDNFENKDKCILHCEKDNWNELKKPVDLFWRNIKLIIDDAYYKNTNYIKFNEIIFPSFELDKEYIPMEDENGYLTNPCMDVLATNFYSYEYTKDEVIKKIEEVNIIFFNCIFLDNLDLINYSFKKSIEFINPTFKKDILFNPKSNNIVKFRNCNFKNEMNFINCVSFTALTFHNVNFMNNIHFSNIKFNKISFVKTTFSEVLGLYNCTIDNYTISDTIVSEIIINYTAFNNQIKDPLKNNTLSIKRNITVYNSKKLPLITYKNADSINIEGSENISIEGMKSKLINLNIKNSSMNTLKIYDNSEVENMELENVNIKYLFDISGLSSNLKLRNILFSPNVNFLDIDIKGTTRETARIIKHSFEQQNNTIEANRFYALEMKEREKELKWFSKDFFEKLIFTFHDWSSSHSQDWILALLWILNFSFISSVFYKTYYYSYDNLLGFSLFILPLILICIFSKYKLRKLLLFIYGLIFYCIASIDLDKVANMINPFSIMTKGEDLTFGILFFKIIITYLIYQLIISIRQNTRRK